MTAAVCACEWLTQAEALLWKARGAKHGTQEDRLEEEDPNVSTGSLRKRLPSIHCFVTLMNFDTAA